MSLPGLARRPFAVVLLAALIGAAGLPFAALMADDLIQLGFLERVSPNTWTSPLELYAISDGVPAHVQAMKNAGAFPWFIDPAFKMVFFRPLSSALLRLDHAAFGLAAVGYALHNALWFVLLVAAAGLLVRLALPAATGRLATLLFAISGVNGILCWTATRHIAVAATCGFAALASHLAWRERGWRPGRLLAVLGFALSLAASEAAVGVLGYFAAYEAFGAADRPRRRAMASLPMLALFAAYLALYVGFGFGASGGSGYLDPFRAPLHFLIGLPGRLAVLLGAVVAGGSADLWVLRPDWRVGLSIGGAVTVGLLATAFLVVWRATAVEARRGVAWLAAGAVLSAVPFAGTPIGGRCVIVPLVGGMAAIAFVLRGWWTILRKQRGAPYRLAGAMCALLAVVHLVLAPMQRLAYPAILRDMMAARLQTTMAQAEIEPAGLAARTVVLLRAPDFPVGFHSYFYRALNRLPLPAAWRVLSWAAGEHRFARTADDTLEMTLSSGQIDAAYLEVGATLAVSDMAARVLAAGKIGPTKVEFRFNRSLDDPSLLFLAWRDERLRAVRPPAIGETAVY